MKFCELSPAEQDSGRDATGGDGAHGKQQDPEGRGSLTQEGDPFGVAYGSDAAFWVVRSGVDGVARVSSTGVLTHLGGFTERVGPPV